MKNINAIGINLKYNMLLAIIIFNGTLLTSFPTVDYAESNTGTSISFVWRHDSTQVTKKDMQVSNDALDKLDASIKSELIRSWIDDTSIFKMNK